MKINSIRILTLIVFIVSVTALMSCAPTTEPMPSAPRQVTPNARAQAPTTTRATSATPTASPTSTSTPGVVVPPTPPANGISLSLTPDTTQTGWVVNKVASSFTPDNNLQVGVLKGQAFTSLVQYNLTSLAPGSQVLYAVLEIWGRNGNNLATGGQWTLDVLDTQTSNWDNATFDSIRRVPTLFTIGTPLKSTELGAGTKKTFALSINQLKQLEKQIDCGSITIRLSGPSAGSDNQFVWEASPGTRQATLHLVVVPGSFTVITATPTAVDVFAAATQVVAQTLQARKIGTPTPLPRSIATATPLPYVVWTVAPTAVNPTEAISTAVYETAVAMTTGTPTSVPLNWYTATPLPIAIPVGSLTPEPSPTPTVAPVWPPDLAKKPLPAMLYNKIAFLSGSRSSPTAWIVDPDGKNLAQLSDRIYYDIAAARDIVSPDGNWLLYNALDKSGRQIVQIWRSNLKSPDSPPEQMTFFARGVSFAPSWSPEGSKIAFTSTKDGREQEIFLFDLNNPHYWPRLSFSTDQYLWNQYPTWSPDGKQIAFSSDRGHQSLFTEIWIMNADGSAAKKIGDGTRDAWAPVWIKWNK